MESLKELYVIHQDALDWYNDARGHYARVNLADDLRSDQQVAFKVIRKEYSFSHDSTAKYDDEWKAFEIEVRALHKFHKHPCAVRFLDCGYVEIGADDDMPTPNSKIVSLGTDEQAVKKFASMINEYRQKDMRAYIVTEYVNQEYGTNFVVDLENPSMYRRYPVTDVLSAISQFIDLMVYLQDNDYVYLDHKLAHTYWLLETGELKVIDWNGGFFLSDLPRNERDSKLYQDNRHLIGMVMYGLLTGRPVPSYGKLAAMGREMGELIIPQDCPGQSLIQAFISENVQNTYKTAKELRVRFDTLMLDYGMDVRDSQPDETNKRARARVDLLMKQASELHEQINEFTGLLTERQTLDELPVQFREEVYSLLTVFESLKKAQSFVLK